MARILLIGLLLFSMGLIGIDWLQTPRQPDATSGTPMRIHEGMPMPTPAPPTSPMAAAM